MVHCSAGAAIRNLHQLWNIWKLFYISFRDGHKYLYRNGNKSIYDSFLLWPGTHRKLHHRLWNKWQPDRLRHRFWPGGFGCHKRWRSFNQRLYRIYSSSNHIFNECIISCGNHADGLFPARLCRHKFHCNRSQWIVGSLCHVSHHKLGCVELLGNHPDRND